MTRAMTLLVCLALLMGLSLSAQAKRERRGAGEIFHAQTKHTWMGILKEVFQSKPKHPGRVKDYEGAIKIKLPKLLIRGASLEETLTKRRSVRNYSKEPLTLAQLAQLLFAAAGKTGVSFGQALRTAPSAGALYPIEVYVLANRVEGLEPGIYHYRTADHSLETVRTGQIAKAARRASLDQEMVEDAAAVFLLTSVFPRITSKYGERGYRYSYMEAGHISQNIYLQAASLGLGTVSIGAFVDDSWHALLGIDGKQEALLYLQPVGKPR